MAKEKTFSLKGLFSKKQEETSLTVPETGEVTVNEEKVVTLSQLIDLLGLGDVSENKLSEVTYFSCIKILSESIAKMPFKLLQKDPVKGKINCTWHDMYDLIRYRPNEFMTSSTFMGTMEANRNHYGNAYALIQGYGIDPKLYPLESQYMQVWLDDAEIFDTNNAKLWYVYTHPRNGKRYLFSSEEIIHVHSSVSLDGITGLAIQDILATTVESNQKGQQLLSKAYENGFVAKAVLQYTSDLNDKSAKAFAEGLTRYARGEERGAELFIPIPLGTTIQPLNMKFTDGQFLELKQYSALQIAAAFGIKPNQINDYTKASYAAAEQQQLAFYIETLLYILKQYEEEFSYKLLTKQERKSGIYFKFNEAAILRASPTEQIKTLTEAITGGLYTPDEARDYIDLPAKGCDKLLVNGSMIPATDAGKQYKTNGGD